MYNLPPSCQIPDLAEIYADYFGDRDHGFFVEVGAYDGYEWSNTWGLAAAGWRGIYYEPVPEYYLVCKANHAAHDVKVIRSAVGKCNGTITMYRAGALTTGRLAQLDNPLGRKENRGACFTAPLVTLDASLDGIAPVGFDLLVIDAEGMDIEVLQGFNIAKWRPKMVIVEAHEKHHHESLRHAAQAINVYFDKAHYAKIYSDKTNNIYVEDNGND